MAKTKKAKSTGRFGTRYGKKLRKRVLEVELKQKQKQKCPYCTKKQVKRVAAGIWFCKSCRNKFTGNAYTPR